MYKNQVALDLGLNPHTAAAIRKEVLTPPRPPPPHPHPPTQTGVPRYGGVGESKYKKNSLGDHFLS